MKFIMATNNSHKVVELSRILKPLGIDVVSAKEMGITLDDVDENGTTFAENAFLKAQSAFQKTGMPVVADDSGLSVDALDGRPGIYSARYAGDNATSEEKNLKLLDELKNVPDEKRTAHFTCSICCIMEDGTKIVAEGVCNGKIATSPHGNGGFGYDPIFLCNGKCFAQLSDAEKDAVSHRGQALRKFKSELQKYFNKTTNLKG